MKTLPFIATPWLLPAYRLRPDRVGMLLFFCASLADGALLPFFALFARHQAGIPARYIGLLLACYAGGELVATPFLGGIADRIGRRPVLLLSTLGVGVGFLWLGHLHGAWAIALCLLGIGISECALHPTISTVIADTSPSEHLRRRFALARMGAGAGAIVGPALGAALATISLGAVFTGCGIALLFGVLLIWLMLPETRHGDSDTEDDEEEGLSALLPAFRNGRLALLLLSFAALEIIGGWTDVVIPLYAHNTHVLSSSGIGLLFSYAAIVGLLLQWPLTRWSERIGHFPLMLVAGGVLVISLALLLPQPSLWTITASLSLLAAAQALFGPLMPVMVNALAPASQRATYMAAMSTANDLKDTVGPASGMYLFSLSTQLPWLLGMPVALIAAVGLAVGIRRHEREA